jgi:hyperosmotically inducible periplasmic protein
MSIFRIQWLILATLVGVVVAGSTCTQKTADDARDGTTITVDKPDAGRDKPLEAAKETGAAAADDIKEAGEKTADATRNIAEQTGEKTKEIAGKTADKTKEIAGKTADKTKEIAGAVGSTTKEVVSTTGEAITDGWITTKVRVEFVDETLLKGSDIDVDTKNHVVTLTGTVRTDAAKARAGAIAHNTAGVTRVVNQLVVK